jgi:phospholipase C
MKNIFGTLVLAAMCLCVKARAESPAHFKKVVWIVFENSDYHLTMAQKDFAHFATKGVSFTNFTGEIHPSQGNYIAIVSGAIQGVKTNENVNLNVSHVGDLLEKAGKDWRVYAENYPGRCFQGAYYESYARKHTPFISFINVSKNPKRCEKIESEKRFMTDFKAGNLPEFVMYIPNEKNDGHDTSVDYAGKWLSHEFGDILSNPAALKDVLFILTFDEGGHTKNHIYTVLIGANVKAGTTSDQPLDHIALLKMIEDELGLGHLQQLDVKAPVVKGIWKN